MLTADEIHYALSELPPRVAIRVLAAMAADRAFEAIRLVREFLGDGGGGDAMELIASMERERNGS